MKMFVVTILCKFIMIMQMHAVSSPSHQSLEINLEDSRQVRFEKQIRKKLTFDQFYIKSPLGRNPSSPEEIDPHKEVLIFLRDHGKMNLDTYLESDKKTCWIIYDFDQFELSYISLDNISKKFMSDKSEFRNYFYELEDYIVAKTGKSAKRYIRDEKRNVKKLAKKLGCKR